MRLIWQSIQNLRARAFQIQSEGSIKWIWKPPCLTQMIHQMKLGTTLYRRFYGKNLCHHTNKRRRKWKTITWNWNSSESYHRKNQRILSASAQNPQNHNFHYEAFDNFKEFLTINLHKSRLQRSEANGLAANLPTEILKK